MKATIKETVIREKEIPVPSWWKKKDNYVTVFYYIKDDRYYSEVAIPDPGYGLTMFADNFSSSALNFSELEPSTKEEYEQAKALFIETISK